jgi:hypothetical protein
MRKARKSSSVPLSIKLPPKKVRESFIIIYELAIRHVIGKPVVQMIEKGERIPFDLAPQRTIDFDHKDLDSVENARIELEKQIGAVLKDASLVDSPIRSTLNIQLLKGSPNAEQIVIGDIQAALGTISNQVREILTRLPNKQEPNQALEYTGNLLSREAFENNLEKKINSTISKI